MKDHIGNIPATKIGYEFFTEIEPESFGPGTVRWHEKMEGVEEAVAHLPGHPMIAFRRYPDGPDPRTGIYVDARAASGDVVATLREIVRAFEGPELSTTPAPHEPTRGSDAPHEIYSPALEETPAAEAEAPEELLSDTAALS